MSNPGPAVTVSTHYQGLTSNQALRTIAIAKGVSVAALGDTAVQVIDTSSYVPASVIVTNANNAGSSISVASVYVGVYTAPSQGGSAVLSAAASASNTQSTFVSITAATKTYVSLNAPTLYVNIATATTTGTVDVYVYGYDLS